MSTHGTDRSPRPLTDRLRRSLEGFARSESGAMLPLIVFFLLITLILGGMGVDFMRHEMERAKLQTVLDRAVLAAANTRNDLDPEAVVRDYFAKAEMTDYLKSISVDAGSGYRTVSASAKNPMKTQFLGTLGVPTLDVNVSGTAEESIGDAEVSLVLDISGSMGSNSRISNMRTAAQDFIDTVITEDQTGTVSVSVVPYTSQVNAGPEIMSRLNVLTLHGYANCIEFDPADFATTEITTTKSYQQFAYFSSGSGNTSNRINDPGCPDKSYERITPFSQDAAALKTQIGNMQARQNTSIHLGMKWAAGLLDPAFQPVIADMVDDGLIDAAFDGRPQNWGAGALKAIVLMTDGVNVQTTRLKNQVYETPDMRYFWSRNRLGWFEGYMSSSLDSQFSETAYTASAGDYYLQQVCSAAKAKGIIVYTIGFEVSNHGADEMEECASSPAHFYRVEGIEISEAFDSIARQLNALHLTN
ncbi:TadE/TadG family type IV pilus assembly protein [Oceanicola sp. S124]|uniref:TadE/TadG family type IV pilus assembly protein n=1 Tax=Oceanicola sp. S124 TaxID=1042378 RepID=UPI00143924C8|nr:TadE/TadG family type IV pilus assembly protein [Oceanicola sp. S124]